MVLIKRFFKSLPLGQRFYRSIDNQYERDDFVIQELSKIGGGSLILDAGCGSQRYRQYCSHLNYRAQDFGQYTSDLKRVMGASPMEQEGSYPYGKLDYVGDIWRINEKDRVFDAILCTEVFEHIPYPIETLKEFSRLLRQGGKLILTAPSNCLRHMDPYFFYSGFSDRWFEKFLDENNFKIERIIPVGDYYSWLMVEMVRTAASHSLFAKLVLAPAVLYFYNKRKTQASIDTLCMGYHVVAQKI